RWRNQEERVAVRRGTDDRFRSNVGARTWPVLDNEWLTKPLGQPLSYQTSEQVGVTRRRERHDDAHRPRRIGLRPRDPRHRRQCRSACGQTQKLPSGKFHGHAPQNAGHSALMLAARITLPHFSVSSAMSLPNSEGEPASTVPPRSARRAFIFESARPALISRLSLSMISAGVLLGAPIPAQAL